MYLRNKSLITRKITTSDIEKELQNVLRIDDKNLGKEIEKEKLNSNDVHIKLLESMKKSSELNHEQKRNLKPKFFWIVMSMYMFVIIGGVAAIVLVPIFCNAWYGIVPSVFASVSGIITALIKIPKIIAEYLFPKEEDDILIKLSNNVFKHDEKLKQNERNERL